MGVGLWLKCIFRENTLPEIHFNQIFPPSYDTDCAHLIVECWLSRLQTIATKRLLKIQVKRYRNITYVFMIVYMNPHKSPTFSFFTTRYYTRVFRITHFGASDGQSYKHRVCQNCLFALCILLHVL